MANFQSTHCWGNGLGFESYSKEEMGQESLQMKDPSMENILYGKKKSSALNVCMQVSK